VASRLCNNGHEEEGGRRARTHAVTKKSRSKGIVTG